MDSSDITKKRKNQALYINQLNTFIAKNPGGDCGRLSTCCYATSSCVRTFDSYDLKYSFYKGLNACMSTTTAIGDFSFGVAECLYPASGTNQ
jgi:hypothetical protein